MLETIRKHHYILMLIIAIVVCVAFVFFSDSTSGPGQNPNAKPLFSVNGQDYYQNDLAQIDSQRIMVERLQDPTNQMAILTDPLKHYTRTLGGEPRFGLPAIVQRYGPAGGDSLNFDFCMNVATMRAEAQKLGIEVDREDLEKFVQTVGGFQTGGQFDPAKYEAFLNSKIYGDKGNTERRLYTTLRDVMLFQRLNKLIGGTFAPSPAEVTAAYAEQNQKTTAAFALIEKSKQTPAAPTDEAVQKFYDEAKAKFTAHAADPNLPPADPVVLSDEKRTVRYVLIDLPKAPEALPAPQPADTSTLPEDQKKAKEEEYKKKLEEHTAAMAKRAEDMKTFEANRKALLVKANDISGELSSDERGARTFEEIVKDAGLEAKVSAPFTAAAAPDDLKADPRLVQEIFNSPNDPTLPHTFQTATGYALFEVAKVEAPALLPLEEVKGKITEQLAAGALTAAVKAAADTARAAIVESIKGGKTFAEAVTAAGLVPVEVPAFTKAKPPEIPNAAVITEAAATLNPGEVSDPREVPEGLLLVSTLKRELPKAPTMDDDKKNLAKQLTQGGEGLFAPASPLFEAWFKTRRNETSMLKPDEL